MSAPEARERNLLLNLRFAGTNYHGFQVQANALSVCTVFQDALEQVLGERPPVKGCSRTDTGVHANKYCISLRTKNPIPCEKLVMALNAALPDDIAVTTCRQVADDFHARYHSTGKEYVYKLLNSRVKDPFSPDLSYRFGYPLDESLLHEQAQDFVGTHDFAAFMAKGSDIEDTVRTITYFGVERQGELLLFKVHGDGFLYKMVRIMVGTLLWIGTGRLPLGCIPSILAGKDRSRAGKTAPACGLYLNDVFYGE